MDLPGDGRPLTVESRGWRWMPWGIRILLLGVVVVGVMSGAIGTSGLVQGLRAEATSLTPVVIAAVCVPPWLVVESLSPRRITVRGEGVEFVYPFSRHRAPLDRLRPYPSYPSWTGTIGLVERGEGRFGTRARYVTKEQWAAIRARQTGSLARPAG
jgi:hypothetical protein